MGAFVVDGQMIDEPFLVSARAVVALAEQTIRPSEHDAETGYRFRKDIMLNVLNSITCMRFV